MPAYDYRCASCGATFEVWQPLGDAPLAQHEECGGAVARVLGGNIIYKHGRAAWHGDTNKQLFDAKVNELERPDYQLGKDYEPVSERQVLV